MLTIAVKQRLKIMNDANVGLDVSFICRHSKWELAQIDIIERLVSVEQLGIKLTEENAERNARLDRMDESNQILEELINKIDTQMLQESVRLSNRADKQDEKKDALEWRTNMNSEESTWPKLDISTIAISVVPKEKLKLSKVVLGLL